MPWEMSVTLTTHCLDWLAVDFNSSQGQGLKGIWTRWRSRDTVRDSRTRETVKQSYNAHHFSDVISITWKCMLGLYITSWCIFLKYLFTDCRTPWSSKLHSCWSVYSGQALLFQYVKTSVSLKYNFLRFFKMAEIICNFLMLVLQVQIGILASNSNEVNTAVKTSVLLVPCCKVKCYLGQISIKLMHQFCVFRSLDWMDSLLQLLDKHRYWVFINGYNMYISLSDQKTHVKKNVWTEHNPFFSRRLHYYPSWCCSSSLKCFLLHSWWTWTLKLPVPSTPRDPSCLSLTRAISLHLC